MSVESCAKRTPQASSVHHCLHKDDATPAHPPALGSPTHTDSVRGCAAVLRARVALRSAVCHCQDARRHGRSWSRGTSGFLRVQLARGAGISMDEPDSPVWADPDAPGEVERGEAPSRDTVAQAAALPQWAAGGSSTSSDDEPDCHICRLTAEDMGEPLIVVCACTSLPVHLSCCEIPCGVRLHLAALTPHVVSVRQRSGGVAGAMQKPCFCSPVPDLSRAISPSNFTTCRQRGRRGVR